MLFIMHISMLTATSNTHLFKNKIRFCWIASSGLLFTTLKDLVPEMSSQVLLQSVAAWSFLPCSSHFVWQGKYLDRANCILEAHHWHFSDGRKTKWQVAALGDLTVCPSSSTCPPPTWSICSIPPLLLAAVLSAAPSAGSYQIMLLLSFVSPGSRYICHLFTRTPTAFIMYLLCPPPN